MNSEYQKRVRLAELQARAKELRDYKEKKNRFGLLYYKPHRKQDLFHRAGNFKRRYVRTGNRFGKTTVGAAEDASWALGYRPFYPEGDPSRYEGIPQRSNKILIVVADWGKSSDVFTNQVEGQGKGKLFQMLPKEAIHGIKSRQGNIVEIQVKSKWGGISTIVITTIKAYKGNKMGAESSDFDAIHIDEPCPQSMWVALSRGLVDRRGSAWFTCTPIAEPWINDMFCPSGRFSDEMDEGHVQKDEVDGVEIFHWMITGSMHDNVHNTEQAKAEFMAGLTDEERETRVDGRPANLTGAIYKEFDHEQHIYYKRPNGWADFDMPPGNYTLRLAIDTHPSTPHAVLMAATAPTGTTFFFAEIFEKLYVPNLCDSIWHRLGGRYPLRCLLEQAAYNQNPFEGQATLAEEFMQYKMPLPVEPAVKDLSYGILKVKHALAQRDRFGKPILMFSHALHETIREFDRYIWDPKGTGKPVDKHDHMMENLYRLVLTGLDYVEPEDTDWAAPAKQDSRILPATSLSLDNFAAPQVDHSHRYLI